MLYTIGIPNDSYKNLWIDMVLLNTNLHLQNIETNHLFIKIEKMYRSCYIKRVQISKKKFIRTKINESVQTHRDESVLPYI